ncbi:MAG: hypothetical protein A2X25_08505 [Chloroflexi bacterium GWB2_49_20]|nr:MAG: hypothetical protein A2X25_08505 [Chloroflexi bacterium GWB2_49_20]OGN79524.1 MAG: hypothetical protein A2X26_05520 [Chloroflexi bacterium GWC2_49_37]OGN84553.1 MAG: hypothetical protein A2X27_11010 [Chloroflexi bacterium GWD2_49_16]HBG74023.1 hypothetical protein [Anaerolineae bacterium]HCC78825.1 hypothetical protein [Anaerolineae bacterium]
MQPPTITRFAVASKALVILTAVLVFIGWMMTTPPGFFEKADAIGYAVCHRIPERSFHIGDYQLPLCARCSGMYLGAMIGLVFQAIISKRRSGMPPWRVIIPLALLVLAFGVDGSNSYLYLIKETYPGALANIPNLYTPNNVFRLLTGSGMGLVISAAMFPAFNQTVWRVQDPKPALTGIKSLSLLLAITLLFDLLVLTENAFVLYPLALISAAGVLVLLTMIYGILWLILFRQENMFDWLSQIWQALLAGLTIGILQIALIDALRFWLTGTWGGFPLG